MKLRDWINEHENFTYTGTIWGEYVGPLTAAEVIQCLDVLEHNNPDLINHPTVSGDTTAAGYYLQAGNLHYKGYGTLEMVLLANPML